tara:strand:+ start:40 stop:2760 length:2721 start_codon:yes stop_codon:yes gene_type:complete
MSTQLIVYPQNHKGYSSSFSTGASSQWIVDGINFNTMNSSSSITNSGTLADILTAQPPNIVNTWYRARADAAVSYPSENNGVLVLHSTSAGKYHTVIYQRLDNLTIGQIYTVTVNVASNTSGSGIMSVINGTTIQGIQGAGIIFGYNNTQLTTTFTAETTQDIFIFTWEDNINNSFYISNISVTTAVVSPSGVYTDLVDGQVICDLYEEEDIPLTLSIDDFKNVAEQVKSYSKDFNLPATKRNNKIFNNLFEITRADDGLIFNPYVKTQCVLKQDGFILFEGYLRMIDIKDKEGEISYNVNLYSEVIALADILKDRTFSNLDFEELEHDYTRTQVEYSWNESPDTGITYLNPNTSGFRDANDTVKYPFIDWNHQIYPDSSGNPVLSNLETAFRPCIQVKYLIDKIFAEANFNYTSDFFNTTDFKKLYMDFNWGSDNAPNDFKNTGSTIAFGTSQLLTTSFAPIETNAGGFPASFGYSHTGGFTAPNDNAGYSINTEVHFRGSIGATLDAQWLHTSAATGITTAYNINTYAFTGTYDIQVNNNMTISLNLNDTLVYQAKSTGGTINVSPFAGAANPSPVSYYASITVNIMTTSVFLQTLRGETGQWDFLKGIMTMFNLVSMVDEDNPDNISIEPYSDIFINNTNCSLTTNALTLACRSIQHDWTDKVDVSQMELKPLTDLNKETIFKFVEDDDDYAFQVFKDANSGWLYGSEKINQEAFTILEGIKEIIAEPFAATVVKPLMSQYPDFVIPIIYSQGSDDTWEGFDNSPRILYNNGKKDLTSCTYYIPLQNGVVSSNQDEFLQFSHINTIPSVAGSIDFVFSSRQGLAPGVGNPPVDNLYSTYWQPYFEELYNADTRIMTLKVNLSPADIAGFKFTDTVMIKNRSFRVNKIEYKPNSLAKVEFILIP